MSTLDSPVSSGHLSQIADWMELKAIHSRLRQATESDLRGMLDLQDDSADVQDQSELDERAEGIIDSVFDELGHRRLAAGSGYPFELNDWATSLKTCRDGLSTAHNVYLFCLLVSQLRYKALIASAVFDDFEDAVPELFQQCSNVAAGAFVSGQSMSFGSPRPDHSGFLQALQETYRRLGEGTPVLQAPTGVSTQTKDGGVDIIAWRPWPDRLPGKLYLVGQCASGRNWRSKSVMGALPAFHGDWFTSLPSSPPIAAMFIPFPAERDYAPRSGTAYADERHGFYHSQTRAMGLILDRFRISMLVDRALHRSGDDASTTNGIDDLGCLVAWVDVILGRMRDEAHET